MTPKHRLVSSTIQPRPQKAHVQGPRPRQISLNDGLEPIFSQLETDLKSLFAGQIAAHDVAKGVGTKKTGYVLPEMGPFRCDNCAMFDAPDNCDNPDVIADEDVPKTEDGSHALVKPDACCNLFHTMDENQPNDNDEDDD